MKKMRIFTQLLLCLAAVSVCGNLLAQSEPQPLLQPMDGWSYETNAGGTQTIEVIPVSEAPEGIGIETESVLKHTSLDVSWDQWWWCGALTLNNPVTITESTKSLKFKVYTEMQKYYIVIKNPDGGAFMTLENIPVEPEKWHTIEVDLTPYIGTQIAKIELVPGMANQVIYVYPYFEDPAPKPVIADVVGPLIENMTEADVTFSRNNDNTSTEIVDSAGLNVPDHFIGKVFKVHSNEAEGWQFWWNVVISLNNAQAVPEEENVVLVAKIFSPHNQVLLNQKSEDGTMLNTAYNWGQRNIVPNEWNEIVMGYISPHRGWTFLKTIELATVIGNTDIYVYFYWASIEEEEEEEENPTPVNNIELIKKNIRIEGDRIVVEGAKSIKLYSITGKLINFSNEGSIPAVEGPNIIVADGVTYKVIYTGR